MKLVGGLLLLIAAPAAAQYPGDQEIPPVNYPTIPKTAAAPEGFVPRDWKLEAKATTRKPIKALPFPRVLR